MYSYCDVSFSRVQLVISLTFGTYQLHLSFVTEIQRSKLLSGSNLIFLKYFHLLSETSRPCYILAFWSQKARECEFF